MKKTLFAIIAVLAIAIPASAKTHKDVYNMPCTQLWPHVKDVLKMSGKYNIIGISSEEYTASFTVGSVWSGKMLNSIVLNPSGSGCEMLINTAYRGLEHNDAGDLKKRIDDSLAASK